MLPAGLGTSVSTAVADAARSGFVVIGDFGEREERLTHHLPTDLHSEIEHAGDQLLILVVRIAGDGVDARRKLLGQHGVEAGGTLRHELAKIFDGLIAQETARVGDAEVGTHEVPVSKLTAFPAVLHGAEQPRVWSAHATAALLNVIQDIFGEILPDGRDGVRDAFVLQRSTEQFAVDDVHSCRRKASTIRYSGPKFNFFFDAFDLVTPITPRQIRGIKHMTNVTCRRK